MSRLKPCRICGANPKRSKIIVGENMLFRISCPRCKQAKTKDYFLKEQAINEWNGMEGEQ